MPEYALGDTAKSIKFAGANFRVNCSHVNGYKFAINSNRNTMYYEKVKLWPLFEFVRTYLKSVMSERLQAVYSNVCSDSIAWPTSSSTLNSNVWSEPPPPSQKLYIKIVWSLCVLLSFNDWKKNTCSNSSNCQVKQFNYDIENFIASKHIKKRRGRPRNTWMRKGRERTGVYQLERGEGRCKWRLMLHGLMRPPGHGQDK